ncbi:type III pantothenate kinase [soil metagenome]
MNLIIDIGNTRTKVLVFDGDKLFADYFFKKSTVSALKKILLRHRIEAAILSSVVKSSLSITKLLKKNARLIELNYTTSLPIRILYKTKETLGNDRVANAVGASKIFPRQPCLVIDTGTCVKYDFINKSGYHGGAISPGLTMRYQSLHDYTFQLPLLKPTKKVLLTGTSTRESMMSGVQLGMLIEMEGYVGLYKKKYKGLQIILTGGDADSFAHLFNFPIFAAPQLTAIGLNEILQHNLAKK